MVNYLNRAQNIKSNFLDINDKIASIPKFHDNTNVNFSNFDVAFLGIEREKEINTSDIIRKYFYDLYKPIDLKIIDLGNLIYDENIEPDYKNIFQLLDILIDNNVKLIFVGNKNKLNIAFYKYFQEKSYKFNSVNIESKINYHQSNNSDFYLNFFNNKNIFENFYLLGYQKYLVNTKTLEKIKKLHFSVYRLSEIKENINEFEPFFRTSDLVSVDISSVRASDAPACVESSPNGFTANEICRFGYYAGLSEKIKVLNLFEIDLNYDFNNTTAKLSAQFFWHFLEALSLKKKTNYNKQNDFAVYYIKQSNNSQKDDFKFLHCKKTNRWWFETTNEKIKKLLPCSFKDYEFAKNQKLTSRIKTYTLIK